MDEFCKYHAIYSSSQTNLISNEFVRLKDQYYLEHAGTTLYSETQINNVAKHLCQDIFSNPHAKNISSKQTEDAVDLLRYELLNFFNTNPEEYTVIFTSGATGALKLLAESFSYGSNKSGTFTYLQDNHTSILGMRAYSKNCRCITLDEGFKSLKQQPKFEKKNEESNSLFVFPAQSNFSGAKYPLSWINSAKKGALNKILGHECGNWFVGLDAASYCSTATLDLSLFRPDFVAISFYKIFGYPTGLGALLVLNSSSYVLSKKYYGGGTVFMAQTLKNEVVFRKNLHERFEDGTIPFLSILSLKEGFNTFKRLNLTPDLISKHTFNLAQYLYRNLICLHHFNGRPVVVLYHLKSLESSEEHGPIVNFNIVRENGDFVGYAEVLNFANLYGIHLRTGCCCNPGACQYFLKLTPSDVRKHFEAGHVCGDQNDLVDGYPTGSVRVSFGYMSHKKDADKLLEMIENCFVARPVIKKIPNNVPNKLDNGINSEVVVKVGQQQKEHSNKGFLERIILYPIKSCGGLVVKKIWPIVSTGLKYDRQWMIINSSGQCLTQKNNKNMCLIKPIINMDLNTMTLIYPEYEEISVALDTNEILLNSTFTCQSKVCGDNIQGWDCGDKVGEWLSDVLQRPDLRLLKQITEPDSCIAATRKSDGFHLSLANKAQYLMINRSSVEWLRERFSNNFEESVEKTIERFRPNFIVNFENEFVENNFDEFTFNMIKFQSGGSCNRCQMICIDQATGITSPEPLRTLSRSFKGKIVFGVYLNRVDDTEKYVDVGCEVIGSNL